MPIPYFDDIIKPTGPILERPLHNDDEDIEDDGYEAI